MPFRIDALVLVAVIGAVVLADRDRELVAGVLLAASILFKLWPIVILPVFAIRARRRAVIVTVAACVAGTAVWVGGKQRGRRAPGGVLSGRDRVADRERFRDRGQRRIRTRSLGSRRGPPGSGSWRRGR